MMDKETVAQTVVLAACVALALVAYVRWKKIVNEGYTIQ